MAAYSVRRQPSLARACSTYSTDAGGRCIRVRICAQAVRMWRSPTTVASERPLGVSRALGRVHIDLATFRPPSVIFVELRRPCLAAFPTVLSNSPGVCRKSPAVFQIVAAVVYVAHCSYNITQNCLVLSGQARTAAKATWSSWATRVLQRGVRRGRGAQPALQGKERRGS